VSSPKGGARRSNGRSRTVVQFPAEPRVQIWSPPEKDAANGMALPPRGPCHLVHPCALGSPQHCNHLVLPSVVGRLRSPVPRARRCGPEDCRVLGPGRDGPGAPGRFRDGAAHPLRARSARRVGAGRTSSTLRDARIMWSSSSFHPLATRIATKPSRPTLRGCA
jgi:hypothetical protein